MKTSDHRDEVVQLKAATISETRVHQSASVQVEEILHEEDEPRRESLREVVARARKRREKVKPCKKGGLRAMMK